MGVENKDGGNWGMALVGDHMAVSNEYTHTVTVYDIGTGEDVRAFGGKGTGPGQFSWPQSLCGLPNGNLLVADQVNMRVQEVTLAGGHVRFIGVGKIDAPIAGLATNGELIAVGKVDFDSNGRILLFRVASGELVRRFGDCEEAEGQLKYCDGFRFSPDNRHIVVAEGDPNHRLSVFTVEGAFVRCVGHGELGWPSSVDFTSSGDVIVCDTFHHRVCVFSLSTGALLRTWGKEGEADGEFEYPRALQVHRGLLYVLDEWSPRVQVFQ